MTNPDLNNQAEERFLKLPKDKWRYDLESGKLSWEESDLLFWLWLKANPKTGKVAVRYPNLAEEMKERFPHIRDKVNKITKLMVSLKKRQRLWLSKHPGSKKPAEVFLNDFPLIGGDYTDLRERFEQSSSRGLAESEPKNGLSQQSSEISSRGLAAGNEAKNEGSTAIQGRAPKKEIKTNTIINKNKTISEKKDSIEKSRKLPWTKILLEKLERWLGTGIATEKPQIEALRRIRKKNPGTTPEEIWQTYLKLNEAWQGYRKKPDFLDLARHWHEYYESEAEQHWRLA